MTRLMMIAVVALGASAAERADAVPALPEKRELPAAWGKPGMVEAPAVWTPEEIAAAQRACISVVARAAYDLEPVDPIREGLCGAPAPVSLAALPGDATLSLVPAATLTCAMAARLREWVVRVLQPTAKARPLSAISTRAHARFSIPCWGRAQTRRTPTISISTSVAVASANNAGRVRESDKLWA